MANQLPYEEVMRALGECQRQIAEMHDRERRDNELRQMADEEFARAESLGDQLRQMRQTLWAIYVACGEDPDGDTEFRCSNEDAMRMTLMAVRQLRSDCDESLRVVIPPG